MFRVTCSSFCNMEHSVSLWIIWGTLRTALKKKKIICNQPWIFIGRTDAKVEAPVLWPPDAKSQLTGKDPDVGKYWGQEEKGVTEDEMFGWHHQFNGYEFEQTQQDSEGQGSLVCCCPWGHKKFDTTKQLHNKSL